jgi:hypothetical protein
MDTDSFELVTWPNLISPQNPEAVYLLDVRSRQHSLRGSTALVDFFSFLKSIQSR